MCRRDGVWARSSESTKARARPQAEGKAKIKGKGARAPRRMNYEGGPSQFGEAALVDDDTKKVVIPGRRAPTVKVPGLLNSMLRLLLKYTDKLSGFLHSFLSNEPQLRAGASSLGPLWPMPIPYPEVFGHGPAFRASWRKRRVVLQIVVMNWLYLGRPAVCSGNLWLGQPLSKRQWCRVKKLEDLSEDGNSIFEVNAELMARAATKTEAASDQLDALHRALLSTTLDGAAPYGGVTSSATRVRRENEDEEWSGLAGLFGAFEGSLTGESFVLAKPIQADAFILSAVLNLILFPILMKSLRKPIPSLLNVFVKNLA